MVLSKNQISRNDMVKVSVEVSNTGKYTGKEVVQLYIHDKVASITQPQKKLIDFIKIELKPGEVKTVSFEISPSQLSILDKDLHSLIEPGDFDIWIGQNSDDIQQHKILTVKQ